MRIAFVVGMASVVGIGFGVACTTEPHTTVIVQQAPLVDGGASLEDASAKPQPLADADVPTDASESPDAVDAAIATCSRAFGEDAICADPDAGFGGAKPYAFDCDAGTNPGNDCSTKFAPRWCCATAH